CVQNFYSGLPDDDDNAKTLSVAAIVMLTFMCLTLFSTSATVAILIWGPDPSRGQQEIEYTRSAIQQEKTLRRTLQRKKADDEIRQRELQTMVASATKTATATPVNT
ncbi:hypothetical protein KDA14_05130, partial [Candidatus Saccharibacteria bacterium]|nr:hypothetical protein [Candidatus Saccharibacteria bacterium]